MVNILRRVRSAGEELLQVVGGQKLSGTGSKDHVLTFLLLYRRRDQISYEGATALTDVFRVIQDSCRNRRS